MFGKSPRIIFAIFLIAKLCHSETNQSPDVYMAERGQFTYHVSVRPYFYSHQCGGALLSDRWAVTSAHCFYRNSLQSSTNNVKILLGGYDIREGYSYLCDYLKVHEHFDQNKYENDVALLRTDRPVIFNEFVQPIPYFKGDTQNGGQCISNSNDIVTVGWGRDQQQFTPQYVHYSSMTVYTNAGCKALWKPEYYPKFNAVSVGCASFNGNSTTESLFCDAENALPIVTLESRVLVGIQAGYTGGDYCDGSGRPMMFTRLSTVAEWIFKVTNVDGVTAF